MISNTRFSLLAFALGLAILSYKAGAQDVVERPSMPAYNIIPPHSESAQLGKYGNYPVDLVNGLVGTSIPILQANEGGLNINIDISYHAAGNKINDNGSGIGMGWTLNAGGLISRTVHGLPDEYLKGSKKGMLNHEESFLDIDIDDPDNFFKMKEMAEGNIDTEIDLFQFNFGGYSGTFYFNHEKEPIVVSQKPLKIEETINESNEIESFLVTTENGVKYFFEDTEYTKYRSHREISFNSAWYLTRIESHDGVDVIEFQYESINMDFNIMKNYVRNYYLYAHSPDFEPAEAIDNNFNLRYITHELIGKKRIAEIILTNGRIIFDWETVNKTLNRLSEIEFRNSNGKVVNNTNFNIRTYDVTDDCTQNCMRLKLNEISINDKVYTFEYDDQKFPSLYSFNKDHWGYYNGSVNSTPFPTYKYLDSKAIGDGANRLPNEEAMKIGILKKIYYPTGGYTEFVYEANKILYSEYVKQFEISFDYKLEIDQAFLDEGGKIKELEISFPPLVLLDDEVENQDIQWDNSFDIFLNFYTNLNSNGEPEDYNNGLPSFKVLGEDIEYTSADGRELIDGNLDYSISTIRKTIQLSNVNDEANTMKLYTSGSLGNKVELKIIAKGEYQVVEPEIDTVTLPGLRISQMDNYSHDNKLLSRKNYQYSNGDTDNTKLLIGTINTFRNWIHSYVDFYSMDAGCWDYGDIYNNFSKMVFNSSPYKYINTGPIVHYSYVREIVSDSANNSNGYVEHYFNYQNDLNYSIEYPYAPRVLLTHLRGKKVKKETFKNSVDGFVPVHKEEYFYDHSEINANDWSRKVVYNRGFYFKPYVIEIPCSMSSTGICTFQVCINNLDEEWFKGHFKDIKYLRGSSWKYLAEKVVTKYSDLDSIKINYKYNYDDFNQNLKSIEKYSNNVVDKTEYTYPTDYFDLYLSEEQQSFDSENYSNIQELAAQHRISNPIEIRHFRGTYQINNTVKEITSMNFVDALFNRYDIYPVSNFIGNATSESQTFLDSELGNGFDDSYEPTPEIKIDYQQGRITEITKKAGISTSYLWAYNGQYVIAKIEGMKLEELSELLQNDFELTLADIYSYTDNDVIRSFLNELNYGLKSSNNNIFMTSYLSEPHIGLVETIDVNGIKQEFNYDDNNRLKAVIDNNGNLLRQYFYSYKK